ncbi:MAG: hypothetical protein H6810_10170 [Phycisphaeraceae bacterium]|nr:MAG: hypothetical protein H6810_10170 [Phycisphaeraceae bacterium]
MPESVSKRRVLLALLGLLLLGGVGAGLSGCAAMQDFSDRFADEARFWGDNAVAAVLGDDPSRD